MSSEKPSYLGRRSRIREKFLINSNSMLDYDILEMLFFAASPRRNTKITAKNLLTKFGNIANIINTDKHLLKDVAGVTDSIIVRKSKDKINNEIIIDNWQTNIGNLKSERLRVLFLNKKYQLISDKIYGGSESENIIHINKNVTIKDALNLPTSYLILCHNHPSGNALPSKQDILATKKTKDSLEDVAIKMLDHIMVAANGKYYSFQKRSLV